MNRRDKLEAAVFGSLIVTGCAVRVWLSDLPNFAPVAAIALFAGYFFRSRSVALLVPLTVMGISDFFIGSYDWHMMAVVYGALVLPVFARGLLRRWFSLDDGTTAWLASAGLLTSSLGASISFFAISNFGAWLFYGTYDHTWAGLTRCYVQAVPFFRYTLAGDLLFAVLLFGGYALAMKFATAVKPLAQPVGE